MAFSRQDIRESIERAGDEHWEALVRHHTDVYPESNPTPGDVCRAEAERLNDLDLGDNPSLELAESRVERVPPAVRITHVFKDPRKAPSSRPSRSLTTNECSRDSWSDKPRRTLRRQPSALRRRFGGEQVGWSVRYGWSPDQRCTHRPPGRQGTRSSCLAVAQAHGMNAASPGELVKVADGSAELDGLVFDRPSSSKVIAAVVVDPTHAAFFVRSIRTP